MSMLIRLLLFLALISYFHFTFIPTELAAAASDAEGQITEHEPKTRLSNVNDLPKGTSGGWLWAILGVVVVGGAAAALGGGGGGGSGGDDDDDDNTGSVGASW